MRCHWKLNHAEDLPTPTVSLGNSHGQRVGGTCEAPYVSSPPLLSKTSHKSMARRVVNGIKIAVQPKQQCECNKKWENPWYEAIQSMRAVCCEPLSINLFFNITKPTCHFNFALQAMESTATYLCIIKHFWLNGIAPSAQHLIWCHAGYTQEMKAPSVTLSISLMLVTIPWSASAWLPNPWDIPAAWHSE